MSPKHGTLGIVIVGTGRSGTTLLANAFFHEGYDMGGVHPSSIGAGDSPVGGGMEHAVFFALNKDIREELRIGEKPQNIAKKFAERMHQEWPSVVKDPQYCFTRDVWEAADIRPHHVILCIRNPEETNSSIRKTGWLGPDPTFCDHVYREAHGTFTYCLQHDIPCTHLLYPRFGTDRNYSEKMLRPFFSDPWKVMQQVWRDDLCHHSNRDAQTHQPCDSK